MRKFISNPEELNARQPTWCPGCGNHSIWLSLKQSITSLGLNPEEVVVSYGVGCSGNETNTLKTYGFHSLHGRPIPPAEGVKLTNHKLKVIAVSGDGDAYSEGMSHFIYSMRGNHDITYIVHDNQIYGLTTGQTSPTSAKGTVTKTTPDGSIEEPVNPIALALTVGATFVARGFSGDNKQLTGLITAAIKHKGFSLVDVFQPCVTFNKVNTFPWFFQRVYKLEDTDHKTDDYNAAWEKSHEMGDKIPTGIFYQVTKPAYHEQVRVLKEKPLIEQPVKVRDLSEDLKKYQ
ncbi:MAG: thiamine pyrophosphate-dependent enzyme [Patescibacteria group bacterium]